MLFFYQAFFVFVFTASDWNTIVAKVIPWKRVADKLGRGNFFKFKISSL